MKNVVTRIIGVIVLFLLSCSTTYKNNEEITGYNLSEPDSTFVLPDTLREISGLIYLDSTSFACIQDENGILYIYDIIKNKIEKQYRFGDDGDYEGITRVGNSIYILRSDGVIFEVSNFQSSNFNLISYNTNIPAKNNEGLCFDSENNRLLIASKGKIAKGSEFKDKRTIYGFDLNTKKLTEKPIYEFDINEIKNYVILNKIEVPSKKIKKDKTIEPHIKFMTSEIAIHPITKKLFLLSASDHLFFIINFNGEIEHIEALDPEIFNKAEGITFLNNGDMMITNEGQSKKPTLLRFNYKNNH